MIRDLFSKPVLIFGCGNPLFGDDGFGPEVIDRLHSHFQLPDCVLAEDVGTGVSDLLFDLALSTVKPTHLFIVDAVSSPGRRPGEIFELAVEEIPVNKATDFSLHQFPSVNLLREMRDAGGVQVRVLAVQVREIPEVVQPGLSPEVKSAVGRACRWLLDEVNQVAACGVPEQGPRPEKGTNKN